MTSKRRKKRKNGILVALQMTEEQQPRAALDLTHILYDPNSNFSLCLALLSLSPILLMPAYASLSFITRELVILEMWAGQLACEGFNYVLKHAIKQDRPVETLGHGYGFPSSHSQWMAYFSTFLILHIHFRHRFTSTGYVIVDQAFRLLVYMGLILWAALVCYSRYHLTYHTVDQVLWGCLIGVAIGCVTYASCEYIPNNYPHTFLGKFRRGLLNSSILQWFRLRDGWSIWGDAGRESEWQKWRSEWERACKNTDTSTKKKPL